MVQFTTPNLASYLVPCGTTSYTIICLYLSCKGYFNEMLVSAPYFQPGRGNNSKMNTNLSFVVGYIIVNFLLKDPQINIQVYQTKLKCLYITMKMQQGHG